MRLGSLGIWSSGLRSAELANAQEAAAELDELGYGALWLPGREPEDLEERLSGLLSATRRIVVATGIVSIWTHDAAATAAVHTRLRQQFPGRFLLGLGVSHGPMVGEYRRPLTAMREYLDRLDEGGVQRDERIIAALAPRMLELARERALGTHPYLVVPEHTARARAAVGLDRVVAPEQTVVLETDPERARAQGRAMLTRYLQLPNYVDNLLRTGFEPADVADGGSDRLVDALIAWGDVDEVGRRVDEHRQAGADHVALQVVGGPQEELPLEAWRRLARLSA
jgi:probable F420-dependent oxidoreductase